MQAAEKLMLVDPQFLELLKVDREYKQIQKPADSVAKTKLSLSVKQFPKWRPSAISDL